MTYECAFDFTVCKPETSKFIGKGGVIELTTDKPFSKEEIENLKTDKTLLHNIAFDLKKTLKQNNVFMVTVKSITPVDIKNVQPPNDMKCGVGKNNI